MKGAIIVQGGWPDHQPGPLSQLFRKILIQEGFAVACYDTLDVLCDAHALKQQSLIIPIWTMGQIDPQYVAAVSDAVASGVGLAGCHGGMCDAFRDNTDWQFMTGSQWVSHPGEDTVHYQVQMRRQSSSAIIEGIDDFEVTSEQYYLHIDPVVDILATTTFPISPGPHAANSPVQMPVVYTKRWGRGRIFYNSLGHTADVFDKIPQARELMRRGFLWAAKEE